MAKSVIDWIALVLVIIGGLNWGLVGIANVNVVNAIFGSIAILERIIYLLVGIAAVYCIYYLTKK
jgi:hypothetical protein